MQTVDTSALRAVLSCAMAAEVDVASLLREHGLDASALAVDAPARELSLPTVAALLDDLVRTAGADWALLGAADVAPGAMGVLDHLCQAAPTVIACVEDFVRYFALVADRSSVTLEDRTVELAFDVDSPELERVFVESTVGLLWSRLRLYSGRPNAMAQRVEVRWSLDAAARERWRDAVGPVAGDCAANRITLSAELARTPLQSTNAALHDFLAGLADRAMPPDAPATWATRVLNELATRGVDVELYDVAKALAVSERTLRRRLAEEGARYSELRQRQMQRRAEKLLAEGHLSAAEIAFSLGFSEMSAFNRAFRRWTGTSPGAWREAARRG